MTPTKFKHYKLNSTHLTMRTSIYLTLALAMSYGQAENLFEIAQDEEQDRFLQAETQEDLRMLQRSGKPCPKNQRCYWESMYYRKQTAQQKLNDLWRMLAGRDGKGDDEPLGIWFDKFPNFFEQESVGSFRTGQDIRPADRPKIVHNQGLVAKVQWEPVDNAGGFTGIYSTGSDKVIMRLSEAQAITSESTGLTPAAAFKFLIDGTRSQNILVQNSFMQSDSWNFFKKPLANRVTPFDPVENEIEFKTVHRKLLEVNRVPYATQIGHISVLNVNGEPIEGVEDLENISFPYELRFQLPASEMEKFEFLNNDQPWYDRLRTRLAKGDIIYEVYGLTAPEPLGGTWVRIANVKLLTDLLASENGDEFLYFEHKAQYLDHRINKTQTWRRHMNKTEAFARNEDTVWNQEVPEGVWPEDNAEAEAFYIAQQQEFGCPFGWLLQ